MYPSRPRSPCWVLAWLVWRPPLRILVALDDIGTLAAFLISDLAKAITGGVIHVDGGFNITGD
ncbi:MAG: SDR family oxidoreductase [Rhodocyclales bacterium]|nr:SDR family oxidoreductase [Rhodocyclales bacterium]